MPQESVHYYARGDSVKKYEDIVSEWQNKNITDEEDLQIALDNFRILFAYNSNAIENPQTTYHDTREIFENGKVINFTGDLRTLFEIENQKKCFDFLKPKIVSKSPLTEELIRETHKILLEGCYDETRYAKGERPGEYKKHEYIVGDDAGVLPDNVRDEMDYICQSVNEYTGKDILTAAAYFHLNFEAIHPFADGNGRVGRTLLNYYLMTHDYPPTIIYNEDKAAYYMSLTIFDKTEDIQGFRAFIKEQTIKTWEYRQHKRVPLEKLI